MTLKLKKLILAFVALCALSAVSANAVPAYPLTAPGISGGQTFLTGETTTAHKFTTPTGSLTCTTVSSSGSVTGAEQSSVTLAPSYSGCTAFGFATAHVKTNGCAYRFEAPSSEPGAGQYTAVPFQILCPAGKAIEITPTSFGVSTCTQFIAEQAPTKGHVIYTNNALTGAEMDYSAEATLEGVHYTGSGGICGNSETHSDGTYSGKTTIKGYSDEGHKTRFGVTVEGSPVFRFTAPGISGGLTFLTGETTTAHKFATPNGSLTCTTVTSKGSVTGAEQSSVTLAPSFSGCTALGFATAHVSVNGCAYRFEAPSSEPSAGQYTAVPFQILCPAGKAIEITPTSFGVSTCTQFIAEQAPTKGHVIYTNNALTGAEMDYSAEATLEGVHYTGSGGICGNSETHSDGTYSGKTTIKGYSDEGHKTRFGVTVA
jgi:hypothetical protein